VISWQPTRYRAQVGGQTALSVRNQQNPKRRPVLDRDPFAGAPEEIANAAVLATYIEGFLLISSLSMTTVEWIGGRMR
jgi:hypothetical protein